MARGDFRRGAEYFRQHLEIARETGNRLGEGNALGNLGNAYKRLGEYGMAIVCFERHLEIARAAGDRRGEGADLANLSATVALLGNVRDALTYAAAAIQIFERIEDPRVEQVRAQAAEWGRSIDADNQDTTDAGSILPSE